MKPSDILKQVQSEHAKSQSDLRDYFAGQALLLKSVDYGPGMEARTASLAYKLADAMMAERENSKAGLRGQEAGRVSFSKIALSRL